MSDPAAHLFSAPTAESLEPLFPQFEILGLLARGGMGAVYRARQASLDRIVAIKILPPELGADREYAERFQSEARLMANLSNPYIVTVFDFGLAGNYLYIVMEFVDGKSLYEIITESGPMKADACLRTVAEVCRGLDYAHSKGLVHLDIKPANIMINREGEARVLDFGLAKLLDPKKGGTDESMGTPDYAAPERLLDGVDVDHRADIYSLGITLYELLTGKIPRGAYTPASQLADVDPGFDAIISKCTKQDPGERYQKAREIFGALLKLRRNAAQRKRTGGVAKVALAAGPVGAPAHSVPSEAAAAYQKMLAAKGKRMLIGWFVGLFVVGMLGAGLYFSGVFEGDGQGRSKGRDRKVVVDKPNPKRPDGDGGARPPQDSRPPKPDRNPGPKIVPPPGPGDNPDGGPDNPDAPEPTTPEEERYVFPPDGLEEEIAAVRETMAEGGSLEELDLTHLRIHGDRAYYVIRKRLPWSEAEAFANSHGAHLATVGSPDEEEFVREVWFGEDSESRGSRPLWIGARRDDAGWGWVSGKDWGYEDIADKNLKGPSGDEPYAAAVHEVSWVMRPPDHPYSALIEWEAPEKVADTLPEPGMPDVTAPPPLTPLGKLRYNFQAQIREEVIKGRMKSLDLLGEKYLTALVGLRERSAATPLREAQVSGEIARFKSGGGAPANVDRWPDLARLQDVLILESRKIDENAKAKRAQLIRIYQEELLALQVEYSSEASWADVDLVKAERARIEEFDDAVEVGVILAPPIGLGEVSLLAEDDGESRFVEVSPDGGNFLVSGSDGLMKIFDANSGTLITEWDAGHPFSRCAFLPGGDRFVALGTGGSLEIWNLGQRVPVFVDEGLGGSPVRISMRPDGGACVLGFTTFAPPAEPGTGGNQLWNLTDTPTEGDFFHPATGAWTAYSPDGQFLAISARKGLALIDFDQTDPIWENTECRGETVVFSPDGKTLICGRLIVDATTGDTLDDLQLYEQERFIDEDLARGAAVNAIALDRDGNHAFFGLVGGGVELWDLQSSKKVFAQAAAHPKSLTSAKLSADGARFATSDVSGLVRLWSVIR